MRSTIGNICVLAALLFLIGTPLAGCSSAPDLVWIVKSGAPRQIEWTRFAGPKPDPRRAVGETLGKQEETDKKNAARLRNRGQRRLFIVTIGDLISYRAKPIGRERLIKGNDGERYRLLYRYYVYEFVTDRQDLVTSNTKYYKTNPDTIRLLNRIGPIGGDAPGQPEGESEKPAEESAEPEPEK